jgi:hypothetical protein
VIFTCGLADYSKAENINAIHTCHLITGTLYIDYLRSEECINIIKNQLKI